MKSVKIIISILIMNFVIAGFLIADTSSYSYGDPTDAEQAHLELINRARLYPEEEATLYNIDLNEGLPASTISSSPVQPLTMNNNLLNVARAHSQDMYVDDYFDHNTESNGNTPFVRMKNGGYNYSTAGENIAYTQGFYSNLVDPILYLHKILFVDKNYPGRGHRVGILNSDFKEVGAGAYSTSQLTRHWITCDFGKSKDYTESFVLGVVYDDTNNNGVYDAGEGIKNCKLTITPSSEETFSASAGGYGIPISSGDYTITATHCDGTSVEQSFSIEDENIKIDFMISGGSLVNCENGDNQDEDGECFIQSVF